ncbi:MAG: glycosyltransferase, partial [Cetobacterium sp.]
DFDMSLSKYIEEVKIPAIAWIHYTFSGKTDKKLNFFKDRFKHYKNIVTICDDMKNELIEIMPEYKDKVVRIYNPMDFDTIKNKAEDYSDLSLENKKLLEESYFVAVSRLVAGKNRVALVEIFNELKKKGVKQKLYILGDGPDRVNIEKKIESLNLKEDVLLLGQIKNPFPLMKHAELFLHTSGGEGFGLVLVESMICDTPVVAYDCPTGPREILEDGKAGGLIPLNDKIAFEKKVLEILKNKELEISIKSEMNKKIDEFSYTSIRNQLLKLF